MKPIVIIGAGMAGYALAREFRALDNTTPLTIVTADDGDCYAKPMLSSAFAQGRRAEQLICKTAAEMAAQLNAAIVSWTRVTDIDTRRRVVRTDAGPLDYASLVIAVGARPTRLPLDGDAADQVLSVNHLADYSIFRSLIALSQSRPSHIAILGAGLTGCEFANDLAEAGHRVTLLDPNPLPLAALAPPALSAGMHTALTSVGVTLRLGQAAVRIDRAGEAFSLGLSDGATMYADLVLSAAGQQPNLKLAKTAGLATASGILVDAAGRTSAPDVYALGDCAEYAVSEHGDNRTLNRTLPYVAPMLAAARAIASTLTGNITPIDWKPAPVIVKTPCFPLALVPPSGSAGGAWQMESVDGKTICRYVDDHGVLQGFGLTPHDEKSRQQLLDALGTTACRPAAVAV